MTDTRRMTGVQLDLRKLEEEMTGEKHVNVHNFYYNSSEG